jgi:hypothetical protein
MVFMSLRASRGLDLALLELLLLLLLRLPPPAWHALMIPHSKKGRRLGQSDFSFVEHCKDEGTEDLSARGN